MRGEQSSERVEIQNLKIHEPRSFAISHARLASAFTP
jgi:hypothetical protein